MPGFQPTAITKKLSENLAIAIHPIKFRTHRDNYLLPGCIVYAGASDVFFIIRPIGGGGAATK